MREEIERRRMAATERRLKNLSVSSNEGEDHLSPFIPMSPTFKVLLKTTHYTVTCKVMSNTCK